MSVRETLEVVDLVSGPVGEATLAVQKLAAELGKLKKTDSGNQKERIAAIKATSAIQVAESKRAATAEAAQFRAAAQERAAAIRALGGVEKENARGNAQFQIAQHRSVANFIRQQARSRSSVELAEIRKTSAAEAAQIRANGALRVAEARRAGAALMVANTKATGGGMGMPVGGGLSGGVMAGMLQAQAVGAGMNIAREAANQFVEAQKFKDSTMRGLEVLLGTGEEAQRVWKEASQLAKELGQTQESTIKSTQGLLAQGFSEASTRDIIQGMADLKAVNPQANLESIVNAMGKIKATGRLQGDELSMLNEAGLSSQRVYEQLAKQLGVTTEEVVALQSAGKISAEETEKAILASISAMTGKELGAVARENADSLANSLERLKEAPKRLFADFDTSKLKTSTELVNKLNDALDPTTNSGKALKATLEALVEIPMDSLGGIVTVFQGAADAMNATQRASEGVRVGLEELTGYQIPEIDFGVQRALKAALNPGKAIADSILALRDGMGTMASAIGPEMTSQLAAAGRAGAIGLVDGLTFGLASGIPKVVGAVTELGAAANAAFKSVTDQHSPSKLWKTYGINMPRGAVGGMRSEIPEMRAAAADLAVAANRGFVLNQTPLPLPAAASRTSTSTQNNAFTITIPISGGSPNAAQDVADELRRVLPGVLASVSRQGAEA